MLMQQLLAALRSLWRVGKADTRSPGGYRDQLLSRGQIWGKAERRAVLGDEREEGRMRKAEEKAHGREPASTSLQF